MREQDHDTKPRSQGIPRRQFIKLATAASLLAACRPTQQTVVTDVPDPTPREVVVTATPAPTPTPTLDAPGRVVQASHAGVWSGDALVPEALREMLDAGVANLTGLNDAAAAWGALFAPDERIAIKVNCIRGSGFWTHVPLVTAVAERLQEVGVPAKQIVIFDRSTSEMRSAGYQINEDGPGVRCRGTDSDYTSGWTLLDGDIRLSDVLLDCDALINIPILKLHTMSDVSFAMKNHYGTFNRPSAYHRQLVTAIGELNALPPIRDRTRLIVGDALTIVNGSWQAAWPGDSILVSFDPVAHDTVGLLLLQEAMNAADENLYIAFGRTALTWLQNSADLGLGTNDPAKIRLTRVGLGSG